MRSPRDPAGKLVVGCMRWRDRGQKSQVGKTSLFREEIPPVTAASPARSRMLHCGTATRAVPACAGCERPSFRQVDILHAAAVTSRSQRREFVRHGSCLVRPCWQNPTEPVATAMPDASSVAVGRAAAAYRRTCTASSGWRPGCSGVSPCRCAIVVGLAGLGVCGSCRRCCVLELVVHLNSFWQR